MTGLDALIATHRAAGRLDLACDAALAAGSIEGAAALAEDGADWRRAARLWARVDDWRAAEAAWRAAGDDVEAARLCLQTGRPVDALAILPAEAVRLRTVAFAQLGLWTAAARLNPALDGPLRDAIVQGLIAAEDAAPFATAVRQAESEPDAPGAGWVGWRDGVRVAVRQLPDRRRFSQVLAAFDPPLPGIVPLVDADPATLRVHTRRPGLGIATFAPGARPVQLERIFDRARQTLRRAHARGLVHGLLLAGDLRVMPGDQVLVDGWHRRHLEPVPGPWADRLDAATPPELALGQAATPAADAWCLARIIEAITGVRDEAALAADPALRPPV